MDCVSSTYQNADQPRILALLMACRQTGYVDMELLSTSLRLTLGNPGFDHSNTLLLDADGQLVAFAILWQGRYLGMLVAPEHRGALEAQILDWADRRVRERDPGAVPTILCRDDDQLMVRFCEERGYRDYEPELRMCRALELPLPDIAPPDGFSIRPLQGASELDAWIALYAESFGARAEKLRHWRAMRTDPDHRPELDVVAVAPDGSLAGCCYCSIASLEATHDSRVEGRTEPVMVGSAYQRRGLGRAMVTAGLAALRSHGAADAKLTTEADNLDAHRLYRSLGYETVYNARWYRRG